MSEAPAALHRADALHAAGDLQEAAAAYREALAADPALFEAWYGLGCARSSQGAYGDAEAALRQAVTLRPDAAGAWGALAEATFRLGLVEQAVAAYHRAAAAPELRAIAEENIACIIPGSAAATPTDIRTARQAWASRITEGTSPVSGPRRASAGEKLRIAYVSAFFASPNWMKPVYGVINHHDRQQFEIHLVATGPAPTQQAGYRDHEADVIWQVATLDDATLAAHLAAAGIDVLIDLNAYSAPKSLRLFARRPAPVQLAWFNSFATSGLDCFDGIIGDATVVTPAQESGYTETVLRVPGTYLAFEVLYPVPNVAPPPCLAARGRITFGAQVSAYKLNDLTLAAWSAILRAAPTARLIIRATTLDEPSNRAHLLARLAIDPTRIDLAGRAPHTEFLRGYNCIDIALDTFPYNGGTTTTEALWQGVPVLTYRGDRWAARTSASLLRAAGLADWVAENSEDFVAKGIALALDPATPARLATLRADMRARLRGSPVCDTTRLCRSLEAIYLHFIG